MSRALRLGIEARIDLEAKFISSFRMWCLSSLQFLVAGLIFDEIAHSLGNAGFVRLNA